MFPPAPSAAIGKKRLQHPRVRSTLCSSSAALTGFCEVCAWIFGRNLLSPLQSFLHATCDNVEGEVEEEAAAPAAGAVVVVVVVVVVVIIIVIVAVVAAAAVVCR